MGRLEESESLHPQKTGQGPRRTSSGTAIVSLIKLKIAEREVSRLRRRQGPDSASGESLIECLSWLAILILRLRLFLLQQALKFPDSWCDY